MRRLGIKEKMICVIVPIIFGIMIAFFVLSRGQIEKLARQNLESESQMYEEDINGWTERILSELKVYADAIDSGLFRDDAQILKFLETSMDKNEAYPNGIYMGDDTGVYLDGSGWVPDDDWVLVERDWYKEGKEHDTLEFGAPYYDLLSKQMCVSASVRIQNTKAVRVMAADVYLDYVCGLMKEIESGVNGTAFLVEKDSQKILAHSNEAYMDKSLTDSAMDSLYSHISAVFADGTNKAANIEGDGGKYYVCMNDISGTDWCLVTAISEREVLSELHWLEAVMLGIAVLAMLLLTVALIRVTNGVVKPVKQVTDVLSQVAEGDFAQDIDVRGSDELARMGSSMQEFIQNMREIITELTNTSEWMNTQAKENGVASANLLASADAQEQEMGELVQVAEVLAQTADRVSDAMIRLADIIHQTKQAGSQAGDIMMETADASHQGQAALGNIRGSMQEIESTTYSLAGQIKETSDAIDRINNMVSMIMEIAEQTNLLSLNASIEAARAGEAGRGFAVVAEEIGKLAVDSGKAASDISELTQDIRETMAKANQHMEASVAEVKNSAGMVEGATTTFSNIFDKVGQTDTIVHHMVDMIDQVDVVASETVGLADSQLKAAQGISASVEKISSSAQSVADNSSHVAENAQTLERQADALADRMKQFTV